MIPYGRQIIDNSDKQAVLDALDSNFLTTGPTVELFEKRLCSLTGAKHAVACSNGTAALHLACMALGIKKGDLGVTTPITFLASVNCIEFCNGSVDFVDIDPATLCISVPELEKYCEKGKQPTVVIPVDFAGVPTNLPAIWDLAKKFKFKVIEDAAHAIGSTYVFENKEYQCGGCAHSDLAIFSFHPVKTITTGEGGAVTTNNDELAEKLRLYRNHGMTKNAKLLSRNDGPWYYEMHDLGYNYRITDIQCALGISQLKKLSAFKKRRQEIVATYNNAFKDCNALITPLQPKNTNPCFHLYPIQIRAGHEKRKEIYNGLVAQGISPQIHYIPVYWQPYYAKKYGFEKGLCPKAEAYYNRCLSLPLYVDLSDADVNRIIDSTLALVK
jgi:UDP-4-amino-4,6-dideoxy-N-acetyl-beta-L-altrosamine transaminase